MPDPRQLVQLFRSRSQQLEALRGLTGGVTATHLRVAQLEDDVLDAVVQLSDPNARVRWWRVQVLDHIPDARVVGAIAAVLDEPVPRVRRNAAHALGCVACKPDWAGWLPDDVVRKLERVASNDRNSKVRREAAAALACRIT